MPLEIKGELIVVGFALLTAVTVSNAADSLVFETLHSKGTLSVQSWKTLRDSKIVKQDLGLSRSIGRLIPSYFL